MLQVKRYKLENGDLDANVDSSIADEQLKDMLSMLASQLMDPGTVVAGLREMEWWLWFP